MLSIPAVVFQDCIFSSWFWCSFVPFKFFVGCLGVGLIIFPEKKQKTRLESSIKLVWDRQRLGGSGSNHVKFAILYRGWDCLLSSACINYCQIQHPKFFLLPTPMLIWRMRLFLNIWAHCESCQVLLHIRSGQISKFLQINCIVWIWWDDKSVN